MNFILAGHGNIAVEMKNSIEMIAGEYPNLHAITFQLGDGIETLKDKYLKIINPPTDQPFIIITDIFSGSPYNAATILAMQLENIEVITGLSLPLCLALLHLDYASISFEEAFEQLNDIQSDFIKSFKKISKDIAEDEEF